MARGIDTGTRWAEPQDWSGGKKAGRRIAAVGFDLDTALIVAAADVDEFESVMHAEEEDGDLGEFAVAEA